MDKLKTTQATAYRENYRNPADFSWIDEQNTVYVRRLNAVERAQVGAYDILDTPVPEDAYGIFMSDGMLAGIAPSRKLAFISARHNDLVPQDTH